MLRLGRKCLVLFLSVACTASHDQSHHRHRHQHPPLPLVYPLVLVPSRFDSPLSSSPPRLRLDSLLNFPSPLTASSTVTVTVNHSHPHRHEQVTQAPSPFLPLPLVPLPGSPHLALDQTHLLDTHPCLATTAGAPEGRGPLRRSSENRGGIINELHLGLTARFGNCFPASGSAQPRRTDSEYEQGDRTGESAPREEEQQQRRREDLSRVLCRLEECVEASAAAVVLFPLDLPPLSPAACRLVLQSTPRGTSPFFFLLILLAPLPKTDIYPHRARLRLA